MKSGDVMEVEKVIIVEGTSDKRKVEKIINEDIEIICTNGTISLTKLDNLIEVLYDKDVYILVDADDSGEKLRKQFKRELPNAAHLYIDKVYREVEAAPTEHLATILSDAHISIKPELLLRNKK